MTSPRPSPAPAPGPIPSLPTTRPVPTPREPFHGWRIVVYASIAVAMTAPGQTAGVSLFIDPMMADLELSRSAVSIAYLIGTLVGASALPYVGRLIDRFGPRRAIAVIGAVFGAVLIALSLVTEIVGLTAGFVGIRLAGQGALGLAAVTVTAYWFRRRRGTALGIVTAAGAAGISLAPVLIERLINFYDWRTVWLLEGLAVWAIVIPLALFGIRNRPRDVGQQVDGDPATTGDQGTAPSSTRAEALRTPYFWVLASGLAVSSMLVTALLFHQISLLGERGLTTTEAAVNFLPQTVAGIAATLLVGYLVDRFDHPRLLIAVSTALMLAGLVWATMVSPGWSALAYGATIGASANALRAIEAALTPRMFGTGQLGAIRGVLGAVGIAASAVGPLLFAAGHDLTGSYTAILLTSTVLPAAVIVAALLTRLPDSARQTRPARRPDTSAAG